MKVFLTGIVVEVRCDMKKTREGREYVDAGLRINTGLDYVEVVARDADMVQAIAEGSTVTIRVDIQNDTYAKAVQPRVILEKILKVADAASVPPVKP